MNHLGQARLFAKTMAFFFGKEKYSEEFQTGCFEL
jgi:hypothetical protein